MISYFSYHFRIIFILFLNSRVESVTVNAKPIDVSCNIISSHINHVDSVNVCYVTSSLKIMFNNERVNLVNTSHTKIDGFLVRNEKIFWLPHFDDKVASNLRVLAVVNSKLKGLTQNSLKLLINLESLDLSGNHIKKLVDKPFEYNKKLIFIIMAAGPGAGDLI